MGVMISRTRTSDDSRHIQHILFIGDYPDALGRLVSELGNLLDDFSERCWANLWKVGTQSARYVATIQSKDLPCFMS
jgi:hypothetical protein